MSTKSILPFIDYAAVKAATTIEMVLHHYGLLECPPPEEQETIRCRCPIHQGTDDSEFSVNLAKNLWRCFSPTCNAGGNHLDLVARIEDCTLHEAAWRMNEWFALGHEKSAKPRPRYAKPASTSPSTPSPKPVPFKAAKKQEVAPVEVKTESNPMEETGENKPLGFALKDLDAAHPWLFERGLNVKTIIEFGLGHCSKGIMAGRIVIPLHNTKAELIGHAGRWPGDPPEGKEKYRMPGGFKKTLEVFNAHRAFAVTPELPLLIFQSYFPVFKLWQLGYRRAIAMMGYSLSPTQLEKIRQNVLQGGKIILFLPDDGTFRAECLNMAVALSLHCFVHTCEVPSGRSPADMAFELVEKLVE